MKKHIIALCAAVVLASGGYLCADVQSRSGNSADVTTGDWDDDGDRTLTFQFRDLPTATFTNLRLTLECNLPGAKILYTTDATAKPGDAAKWTEYTAPIALNSDCTVRFFARAQGYTDSEIQHFTFVYADYQASAPAIAPDMNHTALMMVTDTPDAAIRFTTDGSEPSATSTLYEGPVAITANCTYRARSFAPGLFDSEITDYVVDFLVVDAPVAEFSDTKLTLSCTTPEAAIYYTTDAEADVTDTGAWKAYSAPLALTEDCTVRFFARRAGYRDSEVQAYSFVYAAHQVAAPVLTADAEGSLLTMTTATEGARIYFTTDGSEPTEAGTLYTAPVEISSNGTYRARAFKAGMFHSNITDYMVMHMAVPVPVASFANKVLTLTCTDSKATIYYTTDANAGTDNISAWTPYTEPIRLTADCTVRFFGRRDNFNDSDIASHTFSYAAHQASAPAISRNDRGTHLLMSTSTEGAEIRYTSDGSEPTAQSELYTAPVLLEHNTTYRARVFHPELFDSEISEYITGSDRLSVPLAEFSKLRLVLSTPDEGAQIWYTTDPDLSVATPDDWTLYDTPLALTEDCIVRFFAGDDDANASDVQTFVFRRADYQAASPVIDRSADGRSLIMSTETAGARIYYTTDGTEPTADSELYTGPVFITMSCTVRAKAFAEDLFESATSELTISYAVMMTPHAEFENKMLTLTVWDELASIWFTTDTEAAPEQTDAWTLYTEPIALTRDCTVRFFARRGGFLDSQIAEFEFVYADHQVATPAIAYDAATLLVTISCDTENAEIRYTTDGIISPWMRFQPSSPTNRRN